MFIDQAPAQENAPEAAKEVNTGEQPAQAEGNQPPAPTPEGENK